MGCDNCVHKGICRYEKTCKNINDQISKMIYQPDIKEMFQIDVIKCKRFKETEEEQS